MSDANLDIQPSSDRFRKRLERMKKHPKEYAKERQKRVGDQVEKIGEDQERNREASELLILLREHEEELKEQLGADLEKATGALQSYDAKQWEDLQQFFSEGKFDLFAEPTDEGKPQISVRIELPEGNVQEKIPLTPSKQQEILAMAPPKQNNQGRRKAA